MPAKKKDCIVCEGKGRLLYPPPPHELAGKLKCEACHGTGRIDDI